MNELPHDVEQVLIGSLLGDGGIYLPTKCCNAYFVEEHHPTQENYLKWKAAILANFFGGKLRNGNEGTQFRTRSSPILTELRRKWYPNGKKIIPEDALEKLDALGLAVWYMDDGTYNYQGRRCSLAIAGFRGQEVAIKQFFEKIGLNPYIRYSWNYPRLDFSGKECDKFLNTIVEYIHPSLIYKVGHLHPANHLKREEGHKKKREREKRYYQKNRDKILKINRKYYQLHKKQTRERQRKYYSERRDMTDYNSTSIGTSGVSSFVLFENKNKRRD